MYTIIEPKINKTVKKSKISVNPGRYKFFLAYIKQSVSRKHCKNNIININIDVLKISRQSMYKYRNQAIKDGVLTINTLGYYIDDKTGNMYTTTYSRKKKIAMSFIVDTTKLNNLLNEMAGIKGDWATNHRYEAYNRYVDNLHQETILKRIADIKNKGYEKVRIDSHLFNKKIAYNPKELKPILDFKYPMIAEYKKKVAEINTCLPDELKLRFDYKISPTEDKKYVKSVSIRVTNDCCSIISKESKLFDLYEKGEKCRTKKDLLKEYNLITNKHNDTKSSILRLLFSLYNNKWLDEEIDCYSEILKPVIKNYYNVDYGYPNISDIRDAFKPIVLSLFFAGSYSNAIKNVKRSIRVKGPQYNNYLIFAANMIQTDWEDLDESSVLGVMEDIAKSFYEYFGSQWKIVYNRKTKKDENKLVGITLSGEIFLWESLLGIEMLYQLYKQDPNMIAFLQYDGLYIDRKIDNFRELRENTFTNFILPLYKQYNCYNSNEQIQITRFKQLAEK